MESHPKCADADLPEFTFLNVTAKPKGWNDESLELLWRYNLHYFDYINKPVDECGGEGEMCISMLERWIDDNPRGSFPGWDPYPTSLRIVNWVKYLQTSSASLDICVKQKIKESLKEQAQYLCSHLEFHLLANHLLANAKALVFAGKYLDRRDLYEKGMSIYRKQLAEQICDDGVNFERSPMYHAIIFEDMLDFDILNGATLHSEKIIFFIDFAPVNDLVKLGFENQIQPNTSAAPISFSEGVGDIHFHILFDDLIKRGLGHFINVSKRRFKIHQGSETEVALGNVYGSDFSGKVVDLVKKILMNCFEDREFSCF